MPVWDNRRKDAVMIHCTIVVEQKESAPDLPKYWAVQHSFVDIRPSGREVRMNSTSVFWTLDEALDYANDFAAFIKEHPHATE